MKCRICGANTKNNENICVNCSDTKEENIENNDVLLNLKRKYKIKFVLIRSWEVFLVLILSGMMTNKASGMLFCLFLLLVVECFLLIWDKRKARATICKFYQNKVEYSCNFGLNKINRKINYKDLDAINYNQTFFQRIFDFGDIYIYAKKGNLLTTGIEIKNVANLKENIEKINQIVYGE